MNEPDAKTVTAELSVGGVVGALKSGVATLLFVAKAAQKVEGLLPAQVGSVVNELVTLLTDAETELGKV